MILNTNDYNIIKESLLSMKRSPWASLRYRGLFRSCFCGIWGTPAQYLFKIFCYNCTSICFWGTLSNHAQWSNVTMGDDFWRGNYTWIWGLQPPQTKWPLTQWKICFGGAISSKHTWTQKWKIGRYSFLTNPSRFEITGHTGAWILVPLCPNWRFLMDSFKIDSFPNGIPLLGKFLFASRLKYLQGG